MRNCGAVLLMVCFNTHSWLDRYPCRFSPKYIPVPPNSPLLIQSGLFASVVQILTTNPSQRIQVWIRDLMVNFIGFLSGGGLWQELCQQIVGGVVLIVERTVRGVMGEGGSESGGEGGEGSERDEASEMTLGSLGVLGSQLVRLCVVCSAMNLFPFPTFFPVFLPPSFVAQSPSILFPHFPECRGRDINERTEAGF